MTTRAIRAAAARSRAIAAAVAVLAVAAPVVVALAPRPALGQAGSATATSAWAALRTPGAVVIVRHSYAPGGFDPPGARLDDCSTQRNLDESGRAQARRLGEAFRQHGITVGRVLSSPRCRCLDTARLAFGRAEAWAPLQGALSDAELRRRLAVEIREAIAAHADGPPLVLVTHGSVVRDLTELDLRMGEFVVLRRGADGGHDVAGSIYVE